MEPWQYYRADGCQLGVVTPDRDCPGQPHRKAQKWMANFDLGPYTLRCQATPALVPASHEHQHIKGSKPRDDGRWVSLAKESGAYVVPQAALYARCLQRALEGVKRNRAVVKSPLTARLPEEARTARLPRFPPSTSSQMACNAARGPEDRAALSQPASGAASSPEDSRPASGAPDHRSGDPPCGQAAEYVQRLSLIHI